MRATDSRWIAARQRMAQKWRALVGRWLDALPDRGWEGTQTDLQEELALLAERDEWPFRGKIVRAILDEAAEVLAERSWELTTRRTGRARLIVFRKAAP